MVWARGRDYTSVARGLAAVNPNAALSVNPVREHSCQGKGTRISVDLRADRGGVAWGPMAQVDDDPAGLKAQAMDQARQAARGTTDLMKLIAGTRTI